MYDGKGKAGVDIGQVYALMSWYPENFRTKDRGLQ